MPKVSVIIPVFNVESYLAECLDSVIGQSFYDMEIICIDDCSTDNSLNILMAYAHRDSRVIILRNDCNRGLAFTRNVGLERASGDYILFVDSDDYIVKDLVGITINEIDSVDMVCFNYKKKDEIWNSGDEHIFKMKRGIYEAQEFFVDTVNNNSVVHSAWSKLYKREFLMQEDIRFITGILYEDIVFHFLCMMKAHKISCIPEQLYLYRVRNDSIMTKRVESKNITDYFRIACFIGQFYLEHSFDTRLEKAIEQYIQTVYHSFICNYRRYELANHGYILKEAIAEKRFAKIFGIVSGIENYYGRVQKKIEENIGLIKDGNSILVYGAGDIAKEVIETLNYYDVILEGVAVSDKSGNRKSLFGNKVREITEYLYKRDESLVILAVTYKFYPEIKLKLSELGFNHYLEIF